MKTVGLKNQKGQGLIEYLILVAIMGVATLATVRMVQHRLSARFTDVARVLEGNGTRRTNLDDVQQRDLGDFMNGSSSRAE